MRQLATPRRAALAGLVLALAGGFAACTLNPQPLPPSDNNSTFDEGDATTAAEGGAFGLPAPSDASAAPADAHEAENDAGLADGGETDGGDAAPDAGSDGGDCGSDGG
jgi:hypothetical protein